MEGREFPLLVANWRNELARFSNTFLRPWHKSSQLPYRSEVRAKEWSTVGSARKFSVAVAGRVAKAGDAADAAAGLAGAEIAASEVAATDVTGAGGDTGDGIEAERGCAAGGFADTDNSKDCDAGFGFRARFTDEFNQKEILAVPSGCRTVCRCKGHWPR